MTPLFAMLAAAYSLSCREPNLCFTDTAPGSLAKAALAAKHIPDSADTSGKCLRISYGTAAFMEALLSAWFERPQLGYGSVSFSTWTGDVYDYVVPKTLDEYRDFMKTADMYYNGSDLGDAVGESSLAFLLTNRTVTASNLGRLVGGDVVQKMAATFWDNDRTYIRYATELDREDLGGRAFPELGGAWTDMERFDELFPAENYFRVWRSWHLVPGYMRDGYKYYRENYQYSSAISYLGECVSEKYPIPNPKSTGQEWQSRLPVDMPNVIQVLSNYCGAASEALTNTSNRARYDRLCALSYAVALQDAFFLSDTYVTSTNAPVKHVTHSATARFANTDVNFEFETTDAGLVNLRFTSGGGWQLDSQSGSTATNEQGEAVYIIDSTGPLSGGVKFGGVGLALVFKLSFGNEDDLKLLAPYEDVEYALSATWTPPEMGISILTSAAATADKEASSGYGSAKLWMSDCAFSATSSATRDCVYTDSIAIDESRACFEEANILSQLAPFDLGLAAVDRGFLLGALSETEKEFVENGTFQAKTLDDVAQFTTDAKDGAEIGDPVGWRSILKTWMNTCANEGKSRFTAKMGFSPDDFAGATPSSKALANAMTNIVIRVGYKDTPKPVNLEYSSLRRTGNVVYLTPKDGASFEAANLVLTMVFPPPAEVYVFQDNTKYTCTIAPHGIARGKILPRNLKFKKE